jgi:hypothetical protein
LNVMAGFFHFCTMGSLRKVIAKPRFSGGLRD